MYVCMCDHCAHNKYFAYGEFHPQRTQVTNTYGNIDRQQVVYV